MMIVLANGAGPFAAFFVISSGSPLFAIDPRISDSGNGNHSVSLLIILIKIKVGQMYISHFTLLHFISHFYECTALFLG